MTTQQMLLITGLYLIALVVTTYFTRATTRRVVGALAGGAAASVMAVRVIALCEALGWWHIAFGSTPYFVPVFYVGLAITLAPVYLITWRVARRFGWRSTLPCSSWRCDGFPHNSTPHNGGQPFVFRRAFRLHLTDARA